MKISEKLYHEHEYLAKKYASKIYSYDQLSFEYEDLLQEFKLKIFTSIKAYGRSWSRYRKNERSKPVPIRFYLELACSNKAKDFMKYISRENNKVRIDDINYDYGVEDVNDISPEENKFIVNGIDLLEGLGKYERSAFSLYLRGYNRKMINKVYKSSGKLKQTASEVINKQKAYIIEKYGYELLSQNTVYSSYNLEE